MSKQKMKIIIINCSMLLFLLPVNSGHCITASLSDVTGNWYSINPIVMSWQDAKDAAETAGGYLVSITSGEENKWISDTFGIKYNNDYYWLGGNDIAAEGTWEWANGEPWGYVNWNSGEPNNANGLEDALTWYYESSYNADGYEWNDRDPSQLRVSLVEYDTNYIYNSDTGHWYSINPIVMSWQDAKEAAETAGGYLVSITSGEENKWISDTFGIKYNNDYYWLGGNDIAAEGTWEWANGELWEYANWNSGEPNNANGLEDALTWYYESFYNADGYEWNDRDPSQLRVSLVEYDYNPLHALLIKKILSDSTWKSYDSLQAGWEALGYDDSGWRNAYAPYPFLSDYPPDYWIPETTAVFMWDWPDAGTPTGKNGPTEAWFRKTFNLCSDPLDIVNATAILAADDDFDFYVNGTKVFSDWDGVVWNAPYTINIKPYLEAGENLFAMYAMDSYGIWEWALVDITIETIGIEGDLNFDGCVDRTDLGIILADIRGPAPYDQCLDLNGDGTLNIADARYLVTQFTNPSGVPCE